MSRICSPSDLKQCNVLTQCQIDYHFLLLIFHSRVSQHQNWMFEWAQNNSTEVKSWEGRWIASRCESTLKGRLILYNIRHWHCATARTIVVYLAVGILQWPCLTDRVLCGKFRKGASHLLWTNHFTVDNQIDRNPCGTTRLVENGPTSVHVDPALGLRLLSLCAGHRSIADLDRPPPRSLTLESRDYFCGFLELSWY